MTFASRRFRPAAAVALALVTAVLPVLGDAPASAQDTPPRVGPDRSHGVPDGLDGSWAVYPKTDDPTPTRRTHFTLDVEPGELVREVVSIANLTDEPLRLRIYPADAYNTPRDGAFALRRHDEPRRDVGAWVRLPARTHQVPIGMRVDIPFVLRVPHNAEPGDHVGGIVALNTRVESSSSSGSVDVDILRAVGVRIYARVQGRALPKLSVERIRLHTDAPWSTPLGGTGDAAITYEVHNRGNTRVRPTAVLEIDDVFGRRVKTFEPRAVPELLPGGYVRITEPWRSLPALGFAYTAEVTVTDGALHAKGERTAWVIPWVLLVVVVAVNVAAWRRSARRRRTALTLVGAPG